MWIQMLKASLRNTRTQTHETQIIAVYDVYLSGRSTGYPKSLFQSWFTERGSVLAAGEIEYNIKFKIVGGPGTRARRTDRRHQMKMSCPANRLSPPRFSNTWASHTSGNLLSPMSLAYMPRAVIQHEFKPSHRPTDFSFGSTTVSFDFQNTSPSR